ncbi:MAG: hypothetical protein JW741_06675 [Sedimentisphaerales bacterium]|nr:hypothetical protein [Sedimentisphaerales bacterium]
MGLMLQAEGAPLSHKKGERAGVYLTNALTGWEPPKGPKQHVMSWAELEEERDAAEHVKRDRRILVVLGNPPYNGYAGVSPEEEQGLVEPYKQGLASEWGITRNYLDDLYVRFFRLAERRIAEMTGIGVVSFISNFSYVAEQTYVVMRQRLLAQFDRLWIDCMNGDSRETGKLTPDGKPDPSVFSTDFNREGIRKGTAVSVIVRKPNRDGKPTVLFRHFWGVSKRQDLLASLTAQKFNTAYKVAKPSPDNRFSFRPDNVSAEYESWASVVEFAEVPPLLGLNENRGGALYDVDRDALEQRMRLYCDSSVPWNDYVAESHWMTRRMAGFDPKSAREKLLRSQAFDLEKIHRYGVRPFDTRWCYWTDIHPIWNRSRPLFYEQVMSGDAFLVTRPTGVASPEGVPFLHTRILCEMDSIRGHSYHFPIRPIPKRRRKAKDGQSSLFDAGKAVANLSKCARAYLTRLEIRKPDGDSRVAGFIWMHALAIGYSPAYLSENADGIRRDWPRIPLPASRKALEASAALGEKIAALLDTEADVPGVTCGKIPGILKTIGVITKTGGGQLDGSGEDLAVTTGWGHSGKGGPVMPGKGRVTERPYEKAELNAIAETLARTMTYKDAQQLLGETTCDVYLNDAAYWRNVPSNVWKYTIGGYQVIKKWLSYREAKILGRALRPEEAREVMNIARRIAAVVLLGPKLDDNYNAVKSATFDWPPS